MNTVQLTATVVARWRAGGQDQFYRVAVQRQPGMPLNPDGKNFDAINVRFPINLGTAPRWNKGDLVEVAGFLQQRDVQEQLSSLLQRAKRLPPKDRETVVQRLNGAFVERAIYEVVATRGHLLQEAKPKQKREHVTPPVNRDKA